jgi:ankyrin repeat protein
MADSIDIVDVAEGRFGEVSASLANGADVNAPIGKNGTALNYAVIYDQEPLVDMLLKSGANVNSRGNAGLTPLMQTITERVRLLRPNPRVFERLVAAGADLNARDDEGRTALILAAAKGDDSAAELIIQSGTSLAEVMQQRPTIAEYMVLLIRAGADLEATDPDGNNALTFAVWREKPAEVDVLRKAGCTEQRIKQLDLFQAAQSGDAQKVAKLLEAGADVDGGTPGHNTTALMIAARAGHLAVVQTLLTAGADANAQDRGEEVALNEAAFEGHLDVVKTLIEAGADPSYTMRSGYGVLMKAEMGDRGRGHPTVVNYLRRIIKDRTGSGRYKDKRGLESLDFNGEFLLVKAPIHQTAEAFSRLHAAPDWKRDVFNKNVDLRESGCVVFQFVDHAWSLICSLTIDRSLDQYAQTLSESIGASVIHLAVSDTAGAVSYRLFERGQLAETFQVDDRGVQFNSTIRSADVNLAMGTESFVDDFIKQHDAYVPSFASQHRGRTRRLKLSLPDCIREDLVRLDYIGV